MSRTIAISADATDVLGRGRTEGNTFFLPGEKLDAKLYGAVNKALVALGGKWDRRAGGHVFPFDPTDKIAEAVGGGSVVNRQQALQHFDTPHALADRLVSKLGHIGGKVCLEPSAGRGNIVAALAHREPARIVSVEIDTDNCDALRAQQKSHEVIAADFLDALPESLGCHFVAMNPPFKGNQDIRHVRHAFACLEPGGSLAAIVSEHGFIGQERECVEWRDWLAANDAAIEVIPAGAFKESGTSIQTRMIVVRKAAA